MRRAVLQMLGSGASDIKSMEKLRVLAISLFLAAGLLSIVPTRAGAQLVDSPVRSPSVDRAWGFDRTDLRPDARIRFGVLPNGMRYAVMPNRYPAGAASIRLHIAAGSISEQPGEAGFAHLLEHLAFRGSRNIADGGYRTLLEQAGARSGTQFNAFTSFSETVYRLDLPRADSGRVDTVLHMLRQVASELTLSPASLESEKLVVIEEMRARNDTADRLAAAEIAFFAPAAAAARGPILGTPSSVRAADIGQLRSFYERNYRPDLATVIVVGDLDAAAIEESIGRLFADWRTEVPGAPPAARGAVAPDRSNAFQVFAVASAPTRVSLATLRPLAAGGDSTTNREHVFLESLAGEMLTRRLARAVVRGNATFASGRASSYDYHGAGWITRIDVDAKDGEWRSAVQAAEQELRRALTFGFTANELTEQLAVTRQLLRNAAGPQQSRSIADELVRAISAGLVITEPQPETEVDTYAGAVKLEDVNNALRAVWADAPRLVFVSHSDENVTVDQVQEAWADSRRSVLSPPRSEPVARFAYESFGAPGAIARDRRSGRLHVRTVQFSNNVRLNILRTEHEAGRVHVSLRVGGGLLDLPAEPEGLATFMTSIFGAAGTGQHDAAEIRSIFAGRAVTGGLSVDPDAFAARRVTSEQDLRSQLAVLAAYVVDPGYRPEAERRWQGSAGNIIAALGGSSEGVVTRDVSRILASGDRRFGVGSPEHMRNLTFAQLRPAVQDALDSGALEIGIVGDVDEERTIAAVASTFGALPQRRASEPNRASGRSIRFARGAEITLTHAGRTEDGRVGVYWPTAVGESAKSRAEIELLSEILRLELASTLRERMGATYFPAVSWSPPQGAPSYQYLFMMATVDPARTEVVFQAADATAARLASEPVDAALLARARNPLIERLRQDRVSNERLLDLVARAQSSPGAIDRLDQMLAYLPAITAADLRRTARRYLRPEAAVRIRVVPGSR
jgi:zinc protease